MMIVWWDKLYADVVGPDVLFHSHGALVVHHIQCRLVSVGS
jgi:hypothetical protein